MKLEDIRKRIRAARGEAPVDLILQNGKIVDVFSGVIAEKDVAVLDGVIVGIGVYGNGREIVDVKEKYVIPGLIDSHFHIESSMMTPRNLAASLLVHGSTTLISDPHEIANVMGLDGIRFLIAESSDLPFDIFYMAPSCVPATHLETSGAVLEASDLSQLMDEKRILGLAEVMNFPGILNGQEDLLEKVFLYRERILDGHCPGLSGKDLQAYVTAGMRSDHEISGFSEASEKLQSGMMIMVREGTSAKNLEAILPLVSEKNERRFCFVSDDLHPEDIGRRGHLDGILKKATALGLDKISAIRMATLNPAEHFGLKDRGALAPGFIADMVVLEDLESFQVDSVYKNGKNVADGGSLKDFPVKKGRGIKGVSHPLNIRDLSPERFRIPNAGTMARVIEIIPGQITTSQILEKVQSEGGYVVQDTLSDILKLCVVERHKSTGNIGLGLVRGFGLKKGALASSVAHDSHNVIAVGVTDGDICRAVEAVRDMGGGLAVVDGGRITATTPLGIGGLMSELPMDALLDQLEGVKQGARDLGCLISEPFMALSFLALPVIPEIKLTDKGLIDVKKFSIVDLFVDG